MAKGTDTHHAAPNPTGGWDVERGGSERASSHHHRKADVVAKARETMHNQGTGCAFTTRADGSRGATDMATTPSRHVANCRDSADNRQGQQ